MEIIAYRYRKLMPDRKSGERMMFRIGSGMILIPLFIPEFGISVKL
jgi:hypothetical protein